MDEPHTLGERVQDAAKSGADEIMFPLSIPEMEAISRHLDGTGDAVDAHVYRQFMDAVREWAKKGESS